MPIFPDDAIEGVVERDAPLSCEEPRHEEKDWLQPLHIIHLTCGLLVLAVGEAGHRGQVVVFLALGPRLVGGILVGVLLDVLYISSVRFCESGCMRSHGALPLTLAS